MFCVTYIFISHIGFYNNNNCHFYKPSMPKINEEEILTIFYATYLKRPRCIFSENFSGPMCWTASK